jgi:predicted metallopeptidase
MRKSTKSSKRKNKSIDWVPAPDITERILELVFRLDLSWVQTEKIHCVRSTNANTRAYARIWGLTRIWQQALNIPPQYVIEVVAEKFDRVSSHQQDEILLHEIAHIPRNFSGSLVPHTSGRKGSFHDKLHEMIHAYKQSN